MTVPFLFYNSILLHDILINKLYGFDFFAIKKLQMESVLKSEFVRKKKKNMLTFYNLMSDMLSEMTFTKKS